MSIKTPALSQLDWRIGRVNDTASPGEPFEADFPSLRPQVA